MDGEAAVLVRHKLAVVDYERMIEAGILGRGDRVELLGGEIIDMAPIGQGHEGAVDGLTEALVLACAGRAIVRVQGSIRLDGSSAPQPDLAVLRRRADFYVTGARPGPADVLLLVEVSDSSLGYDRAVKLPLYARAGIGEFWLVDVRERVVEVHRRPAGDGYQEVVRHRAGDTVRLALLPEVAVVLDVVFG